MKVSVVVPTYRSGSGLDRLVASLDAQTMPTSEFEIVFVDDGSPDDTWERLQKVAATRPHVRLERIENSGWPCRPRNIGTDLARGEFVAYMDHDDLLFPDALRSAYDFAIQTGADVVNGKEARTHDAEWAIDTYRHDEPQSLGRTDRNPLIPMNPHKLYRRAFLQQHGIRFREGGRVIWEDIFFNLLVQRHAKVIATLSSVPYYHWYQTPGSGSKGFVRSSPDFWTWLREVFVATVDDLPGDEHALPRTQLLAHQYRGRVLGSFDGRFAKRPAADRDLIYAACRGLQADFAPESLDEELNRSGRIRAHLLRADARGLLERLPAHDPGIPGWGDVTAARWVDGKLELTGHAEWSSKAGRRHSLRREGERIVKVLPADYTDAVPAALRDVTEEVGGATAAYGLRSRASRVTWMAPTEDTLRITDAADGTVRFDAALAGVIDPDTVVFGRALEPGLWDVNVRCTLAGTSQQARAVTAIAPTAALRGAEVRLAYTNDDGTLTLSVGPDEGRAVRRLRPTAAAARIETDGAARRLVVPLEGLEVQRAGEAPTTVQWAPVTSTLGDLLDRVRRRSRWKSAPAVLRGETGAAELVFAVPAGEDRVRVRLGDEGAGARRWWVLDARAASGSALTAGPAR